MEEAKIRELKAFAVRIRMAAVEAIHAIGSGHIGGALSIADVLAVLYGGSILPIPSGLSATSWFAPRAMPALPYMAPWH